MSTSTCSLRHKLLPLWQTRPRAHRLLTTSCLRLFPKASTDDGAHEASSRSSDGRGSLEDEQEDSRSQDGAQVKQHSVLGTRRAPPDIRLWRPKMLEDRHGTRRNPYQREDSERPPMTGDQAVPRGAAPYRSLKRDDGTMTAQEKETFQRLFRDLGRGVPGSEQREEDLSFEDVQRAKEDAKLAEDMQELDPDENTYFETPYEEQDFETSSQKIEQYPKALRDLALKNVRESEKRKTKLRLQNEAKRDPQVGQINSLLLPIRQRMLDAGTDVAVWQIIEDELFAKVRELRLDDPSPGPNKKTIKDTTTMKQDLEDKTSLQIFAGLYQRLLFVVSKILCRRTTYTPLAFALLPAMKSQGPSSYAMGVSSGLFNELLQHHWRVTNSIPPLLSLLTEMDRTTSPTTTRTLEILDEVTRYRARAEKGLYGEAVRQLELAPDRRRDGNELKRWKRRIQERLHEAELEKVRRREQEKTLRAEGALGDDTDSPWADEDEEGLRASLA